MLTRPRARFWCTVMGRGTRYARTTLIPGMRASCAEPSASGTANLQPGLRSATSQNISVGGLVVYLVTYFFQMVGKMIFLIFHTNCVLNVKDLSFMSICARFTILLNLARWTPLLKACNHDVSLVWLFRNQLGAVRRWRESV